MRSRGGRFAILVLKHGPPVGLEFTTSSQDPRVRQPRRVEWGYTITCPRRLSTFTDDAERSGFEPSHAHMAVSIRSCTEWTLMIGRSLESPQSLCALFWTHFRLYDLLAPRGSHLGAFVRRRGASIGRVLHRGNKRPCDRTDRDTSETGLFGSRPWLHECGLSVATFIDRFGSRLDVASPLPHTKSVEGRKQLMSTSRDSLSQIALETGFPDQATLVERSKRFNGILWPVATGGAASSLEFGLEHTKQVVDL